MIYKGKLGISTDIPINDPVTELAVSSAAVAATYIQMWIVTLKKETGRQILNDTENMDRAKFNALPNGGAFSYQDVNTHIGDGNVGRRGNAVLSPAYFNTRSYRSLTMGNDIETQQTGTPPGNTGDVAKSFSIKIPMNNLLLRVVLVVHLGNSSSQENYKPRIGYGVYTQYVDRTQGL
jgi:hypothetical protein